MTALSSKIAGAVAAHQKDGKLPCSVAEQIALLSAMQQLRHAPPDELPESYRAVASQYFEALASGPAEEE